MQLPINTDIEINIEINKDIEINRDMSIYSVMVLARKLQIIYVSLWIRYFIFLGGSQTSRALGPRPIARTLPLHEI